MIHLIHYLFQINVYYQLIYLHHLQQQKDEAMSSEKYEQIQLDDDDKKIFFLYRNVHDFDLFVY